MAENTVRPDTKTFCQELALALTIPFIIGWSIIPTNLLNTYLLLKLLEIIGFCGSVLMFFIGIPVGINGIRKSKRTGKLQLATIMLSILNLSAGIIEIVALILIFCTVLFGGVSV